MESSNTPVKKLASFKETMSPIKHSRSHVHLRKPSGLNLRKGLPVKYNPNSIIDDEEYLLS
jgi:hypothetical protein